MLGSWLAATLPSGLTYAILVVALGVVPGVLIRFTLCGLVTYIAVKVVNDTETTERSSRVREHRMAVLSAVLNVLQKTDGAMMRGVQRMLIRRPQTDPRRSSDSASGPTGEP